MHVNQRTWTLKVAQFCAEDKFGLLCSLQRALWGGQQFCSGGGG